MWIDMRKHVDMVKACENIIVFSIQFLLGIKEYLRLAHAAHELFFFAHQNLFCLALGLKLKKRPFATKKNEK